MLYNVSWDSVVSTPIIVEVINCACFWAFGFICGFAACAIFDIVCESIRYKREKRRKEDGTFCDCGSVR